MLNRTITTASNCIFMRFSFAFGAKISRYIHSATFSSLFIAAVRKTQLMTSADRRAGRSALQAYVCMW